MAKLYFISKKGKPAKKGSPKISYIFGWGESQEEKIIGFKEDPEAKFPEETEEFKPFITEDRKHAREIKRFAQKNFSEKLFIRSFKD